MSQIIKTLSGSIGKKVLMALTGLFLCSFLVIHLLGNLQLFYDDGGEAFNAYAKFMTSNPIIKVVSYGLYASIIFHAVLGLALVFKNKKTRPVRYAKNRGNQNSPWASRNMGVLGTIILIFIVIHMRSFWYEYKWGSIELDQWGNKDLYAVTVVAFKELWYVILYVISMFAMAFHLVHGFQSAFQSLGINHKRYTPLIKSAGFAFSVLISAAFAAIPVYLYINQTFL